MGSEPSSVLRLVATSPRASRARVVPSRDVHASLQSQRVDERDGGVNGAAREFGGVGLHVAVGVTVS